MIPVISSRPGANAADEYGRGYLQPEKTTQTATAMCLGSASGWRYVFHAGETKRWKSTNSYGKAVSDEMAIS